MEKTKELEKEAHMVDKDDVMTLDGVFDYLHMVLDSTARLQITIREKGIPYGLAIDVLETTLSNIIACAQVLKLYAEHVHGADILQAKFENYAFNKADKLGIPRDMIEMLMEKKVTPDELLAMIKETDIMEKYAFKYLHDQYKEHMQEKTIKETVFGDDNE